MQLEVPFVLLLRLFDRTLASFLTLLLQALLCIGVC